MPGAGSYSEQVRWLSQSSDKGLSGAENESFTDTGRVLWCSLGDIEPTGVPAARAKSEEVVEDDRVKTVNRLLIRIRELWDIRPEDRLVHVLTGFEYQVTGVRYGVNETLCNVETV